MEEKIKIFFQRYGIDILHVSELKDGNSHNHLNYKVVSDKGTYVARVASIEEALSYANLSDEYTILKLVQKYEVAPQAERIDLEYFDSPILIEEFLDGVSFDQLRTPQENVFSEGIKLIARTSSIPLTADSFPFKFSYSTYHTDMRVWSLRMKEIISALGSEHFIIAGYEPIISSATKILEEKDRLLQSAPREFIYNDVHPGNVFWLEKENMAKFIDWQKVSLGDPSFMLALFARRFGHIFDVGYDDFIEKALSAYQKEKNIEGFSDLFRARILERSVSDMIWSVWADIKKKKPILISSVEENKHYLEAKSLMSET